MIGQKIIFGKGTNQKKRGTVIDSFTELTNGSYGYYTTRKYLVESDDEEYIVISLHDFIKLA